MACTLAHVSKSSVRERDFAWALHKKFIQTPHNLHKLSTSPNMCIVWSNCVVRASSRYTYPIGDILLSTKRERKQKWQSTSGATTSTTASTSRWLTGSMAGCMAWVRPSGPSWNASTDRLSSTREHKPPFLSGDPFWGLFFVQRSRVVRFSSHATEFLVYGRSKIHAKSIIIRVCS